MLCPSYYSRTAVAVGNFLPVVLPVDLVATAVGNFSYSYSTVPVQQYGTVRSTVPVQLYGTGTGTTAVPVPVPVPVPYRYYCDFA
jgi:hypothetical protein